MRYSQGRILVFAKAPILGTVKTRLDPALTAEECCTLQQALIQHTLTTVSKAKLCEVELWCAPDIHHAFFESCALEYPITLKNQQGKNLGDRMHHALQNSLADKEFSILIGTDCPAITSKYLSQACESISQSENNIILGPALDGGYVLIGANKISMTVFKNIEWGSNTVLERTRNNLRNAKIRWSELTALRDIDRPADLSYAAPHFSDLQFLQRF